MLPKVTQPVSDKTLHANPDSQALIQEFLYFTKLLSCYSEDPKSTAPINMRCSFQGGINVRPRKGNHGGMSKKTDVMKNK